MKKIALIIIVMTLMLGCKEKTPKQTLDNAVYPIVISDITLRSGHTNRTASFTSATGKFFVVSSNNVVDYLIKYHAIGDTIKKSMVGVVKQPTQSGLSYELETYEPEPITEEEEY